MAALVVKLLLLAAAAYVAAVGLMYWQQRKLIYLPNSELRRPADFDLRLVDDIRLSTPDGEHLVAWWAKAAPGRPTILYFHGNAGHLSQRAPRIAYFQQSGLGVLILAYRSFSGSTGQPSESANVADALLAYDHLRANGVAPADIVLFGESLGTGVAVQIATLRPAIGLVLDSPFTSLAEAAAGHFSWLPVRELICDRYDNLGRIGRIHIPLLVLHGEADITVPVAMGQEIFAAANEPKRIVTFPGAQHIEHAKFGSLGIVRQFIDGLKR